MKDELPRRIVQGLMKIGMAMKSAAMTGAGELGLSALQAQILALLAGGPRRLSELAQALAVKPPTASDAVQALLRKDLVAKDPDPADSRALAIELTVQGRRVARSLESWPEFLVAAVSTLADSEQAALHKMLMRIVRGLQETGRVGQARMCIDCIYFRPDAHPGEREPHHCDYINAAFSDAGLRIDCNEFVPVTESRKEKAEK